MDTGSWFNSEHYEQDRLGSSVWAIGAERAEMDEIGGPCGCFSSLFGDERAGDKVPLFRKRMRQSRRVLCDRVWVRGLTAVMFGE